MVVFSEFIEHGLEISLKDCKTEANLRNTTHTQEMMSRIDRSKFENPSPPDSEDDYDTAHVTRRILPESVLPEKFAKLLILYEDELKSLPGSDESEMSISDDDDDSKECLKLMPKNVIDNQSLHPTSSPQIQVHEPPTCLTPDLSLIKIENLSEGEIVSEKGSPKKEAAKHKELKRQSPKRKNKLNIDYSDSEDSEREPERKPKPKFEYRYIKQESEIDKKQVPAISVSLSDFYCEVCDIALNSEATLSTHLLGRRHKKALNAQNVPAVAYESLSQMTEQSNLPYNYPIPAPKTKHVQASQKAKLQPLIDQYTEGPLAGLKYVTELICANETKYYCNLCSSPCSVNSIMQHLIGKGHRQRVCDALDEKYKYRTRYGKETPDRQFQILWDYEMRHGRDKMKVEIEVSDDSPDPELCASRSRNDECQPSTSRGTDSKAGLLSAVEDLDTSRNDYYCRVCDSHMNNQSMWESHIRGKRHMKNKKKIPGEAASKVKAVFCPDETAHLMDELQDVEEPIVGLDYIRETQGEAGDFYNCYLCGACVTNFDIVDHLKNVKHRTKYLETVLKKGQDNDIETIKSCYGLPSYHKSELIREECEKILRKYGPGTVHVYRPKDVFIKQRKRY